jgi:hypothetical protein
MAKFIWTIFGEYQFRGKHDWWPTPRSFHSLNDASECAIFMNKKARQLKRIFKYELKAERRRKIMRLFKKIDAAWPGHQFVTYYVQMILLPEE